MDLSEDSDERLCCGQPLEWGYGYAGSGNCSTGLVGGVVVILTKGPIGSYDYCQICGAVSNFRPDLEHETEDETQ